MYVVYRAIPSLRVRLNYAHAARRRALYISIDYVCMVQYYYPHCITLYHAVLSCSVTCVVWQILVVQNGADTLERTIFEAPETRRPMLPSSFRQPQASLYIASILCLFATQNTLYNDRTPLNRTAFPIPRTNIENR